MDFLLISLLPSLSDKQQEVDVPLPPTTPSTDAPPEAIGGGGGGSSSQEAADSSYNLLAAAKPFQKPEVTRKISDEGLRSRINVSDVSTIRGVDIRTADTEKASEEPQVPRYGMVTDKEEDLGKVSKRKKEKYQCRKWPGAKWCGLQWYPSFSSLT